MCIEVIVKVCGRVGGEGGCMRVLPSPPTCHCQMSPLPSHLSFSHDPPLPSLSLMQGYVPTSYTQLRSAANRLWTKLLELKREVGARWGLCRS